MSIRKRNEFLEDGDSDEDGVDRGYDSEASEQGRGDIVAGRGAKRRRTGDAFSDDEGSINGVDEEPDRDAEDEHTTSIANISKKSSRQPNYTGEESEGLDNYDQDDQLEDDSHAHDDSKSRSAAPPRQVTAAHRAAHKSGVLYISRVPPFMKPQTLKHLLEPHAPKGLGRIFLTPEDAASHTRRVRRGGNKKKSFTDGWVEFTSKRDAKLAAETLNGNLIGGKKGSFYHDDLWNLKYLRGFKWSHLTEQIAAENAERAARLREEVRRTKAENRAFVMDVEKGKMFETREEKRRARAEREGLSAVPDVAPSAVERPRKGLKQKQSRRDHDVDLEEGRDMKRITKLGAMIM